MVATRGSTGSLPPPRTPPAPAPAPSRRRGNTSNNTGGRGGRGNGGGSAGGASGGRGGGGGRSANTTSTTGGGPQQQQQGAVNPSGSAGNVNGIGQALDPALASQLIQQILTSAGLGQIGGLSGLTQALQPSALPPGGATTGGVSSTVANPTTNVTTPGGGTTGGTTGGAAGSTLPPTVEQIALNDLDSALAVCDLSNQTGRTRFMTSQGLRSVKDFIGLTPKDIKSLVESFNLTCTGSLKGEAIGFMPLKKIQALAYAVGKKHRMNETFYVGHWNEEAVQRARDEMANFVDQDKSSEPKEFKNPQDKTIDLEYEEWRNHCATVLSQIQSRRGGGLTLAYVVLSSDGVVVLTGDFEKLHHAAALHGPVYDYDNRKVWAMLKAAVISTKLWSYIERFDTKADGRSGFLELDRIFLGADFVEKRLNLCYLVVELGHGSSVMYSGEPSGYTFIAYAGALVKNYAYIGKHRGQIDQRVQVLRLVNGITGDAKTRLSYSIEQVKDHHRDNMQSAITYLSGKVNDAYSEYNAGTRKMKQLRASRGGRGGKPGGGGRGGRGGRGGQTSDARYDGTTEVKMIAGQNTSDDKVFDQFPAKLFHGALRTYVLNRRKFLRDKAEGPSHDKRKIQELTSKLESSEQELKKLKSEQSSSKDKGGNAGLSFGKNAHKNP